MACVKFQENRFIIDGEMDKKHALQIDQNNCGPGYRFAKLSRSASNFPHVMSFQRGYRLKSCCNVG